jgi:NitT/TauT family transport system substrate-binding protein
MPRPLSTLTAGLGLLVTAACGGGDEAAEPAPGAAADGGSTGLTPVTVGVIPILDVAPAYLCQDQGIFEENGLDVTLEPAQGGAAIVPAVLAGQQEFGFSNVTSLLLGQSRGLPLQVVAPGSASTGDPGSDFASVVVPGDSDIQDAGDLAGRTVAINTLNNIGDTVVREAMRKAGGDPSAVQFVELPFPDMPAALEAGRVDAVFVVEPFQTITQNQGGRPISSVYAEATEDLQVAAYFTSDRYAQANPDVVQSFSDALVECQQYAQDNPDEARRILAEYTRIDPAIIPDLTLPAFPGRLNRESVQVLSDLAVEDGLLEQAPDLSELLPAEQ